VFSVITVFFCFKFKVLKFIFEVGVIGLGIVSLFLKKKLYFTG
jgi:hypothetical protein